MEQPGRQGEECLNDNIPDGVENHFAVGSLHKPMCLLLSICEGSSEQYDSENMLDDINMALSFDTSDITDHIHTCECWSMKSLAAEVCLHLARRREPGDAARESHIDRGTEMATKANQRVKAANGMVKHVLAYEANKDIRKKLRELANEQDDFNRKVIYDSSVTRLIPNRIGLKSSTTSTFSSRLNVKDDCSKTNESSTANSKASAVTAPTHVSTKKKVAFSHLSSLGSSGGASKQHSSNHSNESIHSNQSTNERKVINGDEADSSK